MKYKTEVLNLRGGRRVFLIDFQNEKYDALTSFFNEEAVVFGDAVKKAIMRVLSGEEKEFFFRGNLNIIEITPQTTTVIELYGKEAGKSVDRCEVDTRKLLRAVSWWSDFVREWTRTGESDAVDGLIGELDL